MDGVRLDQWLWAARFFKTRALARAAIDGGKVQYQGHTGKPGKRVDIGAKISVQRGQEQWVVVVTGLAAQRRGASEAAALYAETPASEASRAQRALDRKVANQSFSPPAQRPDRRDRGRIIRFQRLEKS